EYSSGSTMSSCEMGKCPSIVRACPADEYAGCRTFPYEKALVGGGLIFSRFYLTPNCYGLPSGAEPMVLASNWMLDLARSRGFQNEQGFVVTLPKSRHSR